MTLVARIRTLREITAHPLNRQRKLGAVMNYLRWNLGHRILRTDHLLPLTDQASIILSHRQNYATLAYTCGLWDFEEMMFALHLLRPGDVFVDGGANVGGYTILASAVAGARSVAFEPVPASYDELTRNIRLNNISDLVDAHCRGLGDAPGTVRMTANRGGLNHVTTKAGSSDGIVDVAVMRLDDAVGAGCNLLKLDTEGYERNVLLGGQRILASMDLHAVIIELNGSGARYGSSDEDVHQEIVRHGFQVHRYYPKTRQLKPLPSYNRDGLNTLYVRPSRHVTDRLVTAPKYSIRGLAF